jgi:hypothetical protein
MSGDSSAPAASIGGAESSPAGLQARNTGRRVAGSPARGSASYSRRSTSPYAQVERREVAALALGGALAVVGAGVEQHLRGLAMAGDAGVVEREGIPWVIRVHVGAGFNQAGDIMDGRVQAEGLLHCYPWSSTVGPTWQ